MMKWFHMASISIATIILTGCATPMTPQDIAKYFDAPSAILIEEPIYVSVSDERPEEERIGTGWSERYISTVDGTDADRTARFFAEDLASLLQRKRITEKAYPVKEGTMPSNNTTFVTVRLLSWYGRVTDFSKLPITERGMMTVLGYKTPAYDNHGECRFSASITRSGQVMELGDCNGEYTLYLNKGGTMEHANALSGAAADRAFVQFLKAFEKTLGTSKK